jgi:inactivated superfamily I helicase/RecB family exonuclease
MSFHIKKVAFRDDLLSRLAEDLLAVEPGSGQGDLSRALVVLPSARACRTLGHVLLEKSGREALLLPRAMTAAQMFQEEFAAQDLASADIPDDAIRYLLLAHRLEELPWLRERPENGPGLAREFVAFFDEVRLHGRPDLLQAEASVDSVIRLGHVGAAEVLARDIKRLGEVWNIYRQAVPLDSVDMKVAAAAAAETRSQPPVNLMAVAGIGLLDPATARLIRARAAAAGQAWLYLPEKESLLSRFLAATWGPGSNDLDPLAPARKVCLALTGQADPEPVGLESLRKRLDGLGTLDSLWAPAGPVELVPCVDPEQESLFIADRVVNILGSPGGATSRTAVVTNDPVLAARVVAQLRDAGIDVDDTLGQPLAALPAGLLLRFMLRAALTGLRPEYLLEVLTHPYTRRKSTETGREFSTLTLERLLRSSNTLPAGPGELLRLARERDEAAAAAYGQAKHRLEGFVADTVAGFQPLLDLAVGEHPAADYLAAAREAWRLLAPETALTEDRSRADVTAIHRLLARLEKDQALLPVLGLAAFAADLNRLLAAENVPAHRSQGLPVLVAGLVEARLERYDNLIIAGLNEGRFPTRRQRPLFLDSRVRSGLALPLWNDALARDADLFLRLVHNAPRVLLTWSTEDGGQPLLPSAFVERLMLGRPDQSRPEPAAQAPVWRREPVGVQLVQAGQGAFLDEPLDVPALAAVRETGRLSWSGLRTWRECPYRFLLERGLVLRKEEEVQEEFSKADHGSLVHEVMRQFLDPAGIGWTSLAGEQRAIALAELESIARAEFTPEGKTLPGRVLWLNSFLETAPAVVDFELARFQTWRPARLEAEFRMTLADIILWMKIENARGEAASEVPELTAEQENIVLAGVIDRVDVSALGAEQCAVIDYKTGKPPPAKQVKELRDLQVLLYSLAVETGQMQMAVSKPRVTRAFYYEVGRDRVGPPTKPHFDGDRQILLDAAGSLVDLACRATVAGPYPLIPEQRAGEGPTQPPCHYCDFQGVCRIEERPGLPPPVQIRVDKLPATRKGGAF